MKTCDNILTFVTRELRFVRQTRQARQARQGQVEAEVEAEGPSSAMQAARRQKLTCT